jgi:outer membrane protein assembly factor BamB
LIQSVNGREVVIVHGWHDLKGYDLKTGEEMWSYPMEHGGKHLVASLACDEDRVVVTGAKRVIALSLSMLAAGGEPLVWSRPIPGEKSSTPVVTDGLVFLVTEPGLAYCLESSTGEVVWKERLEGRYFSSVLSVADKILFTNESGRTTVVAAARQFRSLAKNTLGESVYASIAPAGDRLFVRTSRHLYCLGQPRR